jgi:hypothetical protein
MNTSNQSRLEKTLTRILDQIECLQEQIFQARNEEEKATLKHQLRNLKILRAYYVKLILIK